MAPDAEVGAGESMLPVPFWFIPPVDVDVGAGQSVPPIVFKRLVDIYIVGRPKEVVVLLNVTKMVEIAVIVGVI
jgi:hypothetical protein